MLIEGNTKLGKSILTWSLPAISTCPGSTETCRSLCYADNGFYKMRNVIDSLAEKDRESRSTRFVARMCEALSKSPHRVVRVHASGDFRSAAYTRAWIEIAQRNPSKLLYAYSRSWRVEEILPELKRFGRLRNVVLWFSCDKETGAPPRVKGIRRAYMATDDNDKPGYKVDLVFRVDRKTPMKFDPTGALVCPVEQGVDRKKHITCDTCRLCFSGRDIPRR